MGVTSNWCHPQGHHARRPPTTVPLQQGTGVPVAVHGLSTRGCSKSCKSGHPRSVQPAAWVRPGERGSSGQKPWQVEMRPVGKMSITILVWCRYSLEGWLIWDCPQCRPGATSCKNGRRASEDLAYGLTSFIRQRCLLGKGFQVCPWRGARLLAGCHLGGVAPFLVGRAIAACTRSPTKRAMWFLRACFMVFPLSTSLAMRTPALSTGPLSRGMAEQNSPLKIFSRPCPC